MYNVKLNSNDELLVVGFDDGNSKAKISTDNVEVMYDSGVTPLMYTSSGEEEDKDRDIITIGDNKVAVGESRDSMQRNKVKDNYAIARMLPAVSYAIERYCADRNIRLDNSVTRRQKIALAIGTPLTQASVLRKEYIDAFIGSVVAWKYKGINYEIEVPHVRCYPQNYAPMLKNYNDYFKEKKISIMVDIGGGTTDVMILEHVRNRITGTSEPVVKNKNSFNVGVIHLLNQIKRELSVVGIDAREEIILEAIQGGSFSHKNYEYIQNVCETITDKFVRELIAMLRENGYDLSYPTYFIGGGYQLLKGYIDRDKTILMSGSFDALENARAFRWLLETELNKMSDEEKRKIMTFECNKVYTLGTRNDDKKAM